MKELVIDSFAGGGGASTGIEIALGRSPDYAINHDAVALGVHAANHPLTEHLVSNIWKAEPENICRGRKVGLFWASPDCRHFSKAKGGKPVKKNIRGLAHAILMWAQTVKPRIIILENVEEFQTWGPLLVTGLPCPDRKGKDFKAFITALRREGYRVDWKELRACDHGAPTTRKRLFIIARCDNAPIVWPKPTHGDPASDAVRRGRRKPWVTAASIIDWTLPCPSIFASSAEIKAEYGLRAIRPLVSATMARIAKGVWRYVLTAAKPFVIPITHTRDKERGQSIDVPLCTVTGRGEQALVTPVLINTANSKTTGRAPNVWPLGEPSRTITGSGALAVATPFITKFNGGATGHAADEPLHTITSAHSDTHPGGATPLGVVAPILSRQFGNSVGGRADEPAPTVMSDGGGKTALVSAFLAKHFGDNGQAPGLEVMEPVSTVTAVDHHALVSAGMVSLKGSDRRSSSIDEPTPTQTAGGWHQAEVRAFLVKYFGTDQDPKLEEPLHTQTTRARFGIVTVLGELYQIVDIGMRMLTPRELFRAQGFLESYIIDRTAAGEPVSKTDQIRLCGNSVCPQVAAAIVAANYVEVELSDERPVPAFDLIAAE